MAFPHQFLDEIRARVGLADLIGRRVKLVKRGREHSGLCPFHSEKTPSFTVSEEKGFFHCFGCGAHGDAIGFVMRADGVSFPEAVERLAAQAGLDVPVSSPEERAREQRRATLYQVMEAACAFYEKELRRGPGRGAMDYLTGRFIDAETIARFRLGFAPAGRSAVKVALCGEEISEDQLIEAGLLIKPDDGGASYDRFRGRVMFPITDPRGRVVAFGARALGDGQPKYLNSPDTPLFNKGRLLYGVANAWPAARDRDRVVVVEGYTDVIALARAGIAEAVAPLGTAVTESQIELLWRMADEPVLCFDGDDAGRRAATRAAQRALPLLKPGKSLQFVTLPRGQDPDSLIAARGVGAMEELLGRAAALDAVIWELETAGKRLDTPERMAGLEKRLDGHTRAIADGAVQYRYRESFQRRLREFARPSYGNEGRKPGFGRRRAPPRHGGAMWGGGLSGPFRGAQGASQGGLAPSARTTGPEGLSARREQIMTAILVNHTELLTDYAETFGSITFSDTALDKLRQEILLLYGSQPDLDTDSLKRHLKAQGFEGVLSIVLGPDVYLHAAFARPDAGAEAARVGFAQAYAGLTEPDRQAQIAEAEQAFAKDPTAENWTRLEKSMTNSHHHSRNDRLAAETEAEDSLDGGVEKVTTS